MTKKQRQYNQAKIIFSTNDVEATGQPHAKKKKKTLNTDLILFTKVNSKGIIKLNVKQKTVKLVEDNIREKLDYIGYSDDLLDTI